jgi:hypothetical protein
MRRHETRRALQTQEQPTRRDATTVCANVKRANVIVACRHKQKLTEVCAGTKRAFMDFHYVFRVIRTDVRAGAKRAYVIILFFLPLFGSAYIF